MSDGLTPFHIAFPVHDIAEARRFYGGLMGLPEGRSAPTWVDYDLYGHQIVAHLTPDMKTDGGGPHNVVDGHDVPVPHFGVVLDMERWEALAEKLRAQGVRFVIEPSVRFQGQAAEQATMFFFDPSGNALEFKGFRDFGRLFEK